MSVLRLVLREIQHRKLNFLLALVSVVLAVGLAVAVRTLRDASGRELAAVMLDLDYNVIILPEDVNELEYWRSGYSTTFMPADYVHKMAQSQTMVIRHLQARLQMMRPWRGEVVLLTGLLPEVPLAHRKAKPPMGVKVSPGELVLGSQVAEMTGLGEGDEIADLLVGKTLRVAGVLAAKGGVDDIRIFGHLKDVQVVLNRPGDINEIRALNCLCTGVSPEEMLQAIRADVQQTLPGTHVVRIEPTAHVRQVTRIMDAKQSAYLVAAVAAAVCVWVALLTLGNARERRGEIGILRAMGVGGSRVAALFLVKAVLLGLVGAAAGFAAGMAFAAFAGPAIFQTARARITVAYDLLGWSLLAAPLLCATASFIPAMLAAGQDPAVVLREE